jgi:putative heme iron utilization protein
MKLSQANQVSALVSARKAVLNTIWDTWCRWSQFVNNFQGQAQVQVEVKKSEFPKGRIMSRFFENVRLKGELQVDFLLSTHFLVWASHGNWS